MRVTVLAVLMSACTGGVVCGPGTEEVDGVCIARPPPVLEAPTPVELPTIPMIVPTIALEPPAPPAEAALAVAIAADGSVTVAGAPLADDAGLGALVSAYLAALPHAEDASAHIVADPAAPHARALEVMTGLRAAGLTRMSIDVHAE